MIYSISKCLHAFRFSKEKSCKSEKHFNGKAFPQVNFINHESLRSEKSYVFETLSESELNAEHNFYN